MPTSIVSLDVSQYVRINTAYNPLILEAHRDVVRVVISELQPARANNAFHKLGGGDDPLTFNSIDTNVWALAMSGESSLIVTETESIPVADFFFRVSQGRVYRHTANNVTSHSFDISPDIKTIGAYGVSQLYVWPTAATIDYISSDSAADTHEITVIGLDANYEKVAQVIALTGTTPAALTTPIMRINHFLNDSATATVGNVFLWDSPSGNGTEHTAGVPDDNGSVKAFIAVYVGGGTISDEHHMSTVFTVPADKTGYIVFGKATVSDAKALELSFWVRKFGKVFLQTHHIDIKDNNYDYFFKLPGRLEEKSDIEVRATVDVGTAEVSAHYDIIAVDN